MTLSLAAVSSIWVGDSERASADSEVRPGPRPQTLCPYQVKTPQAGPGSEDYLHPPCRFGSHVWGSDAAGSVGHNSQLCAGQFIVHRALLALNVWTFSLA
jgi:hypothetical protein